MKSPFSNRRRLIRNPFKKSYSPEKKGDDGRDLWQSRISYLLASMGGAIGFGNLLRFPSQVFNNNGKSLQMMTPTRVAKLIIFCRHPMVHSLLPCHGGARYSRPDSRGIHRLVSPWRTGHRIQRPQQARSRICPRQHLGHLARGPLLRSDAIMGAEVLPSFVRKSPALGREAAGVL